MPATTAAAPPPTVRTTPEQTYKAVASFLPEQIDALGIPGAAIAVVSDDVQVNTSTTDTT